MSVAATDLEWRIVDAVHDAVGPRPIFLCGSRATGTAVEGSDYDIMVVLPLHVLPFALRRLKASSDRLGSELGVPVSLQPLPTFRLRHPGRSLFVWKVRREGLALGSATPPLPVEGTIVPSRVALFSYALSGLRYLIDDLDPGDLSAPILRSSLAHGVEKALLHAAQVRLLSSGRYASRLEEAMRLLEGTDAEGLADAAERSIRPASWFVARDALLLYANVPTARGGMSALLANAQYLALSTIDGRRVDPRVLFARPAVGDRLAACAVCLASALGHEGIGDELVESAWRELPRCLRPAPRWRAIRDVVVREWPRANPLVGW